MLTQRSGSGLALGPEKGETGGVQEKKNEALVGGSRVLRACAVITVFYIFGKIKTRFDLI